MNLPNPMLEQLKSLNSPQMNNNLNMLVQLLNNSNNPQQLIQSMVAKNPQLTQLIQQYGNGDPKAACYEYARKTGQNLDQVINLLERYNVK